MTHLVLQQRNAGFFSDFNLIVVCLKYFYDNKIEDFNIYWTNELYQTTQENMFDSFFFKNKRIHKFSDQFDVVHNAGDLGGTLFKQFNEHSVFVDTHNVLAHYNYFQNFIFLKCKQNAASKKNSLGVHIRRTDHHQHYPLLDLNYYISYIKNKLAENVHANVFIATDEIFVIDCLQKEFGDKVFFNTEINRSTNQTAIHSGTNGFQDKHKLALDVLTDAISLSMCDEILVTSSNVSAYSLMVNPHIKYTFIDKPKN